MHLHRTLEDGSTIVRDDDGYEAVLKPGQLEQVEAVKPDQRRRLVERFVAQNEADPTGGRSERDEQAIETAQNASTGESHQEGERG